LGDPAALSFPAAALDREGCDMSFSGLKTAVLRARDALVAEKGGLTCRTGATFAPGFRRLWPMCWPKRPAARWHGLPRSGAGRGGGRGGKQGASGRLETVAAEQGRPFLAPPLRLCTDNAAMIAWAGIERLRGLSRRDGLCRPPALAAGRPRPALLGSGKKGAKA
jgi:N6-L-threonylcarbamoyladenine synthase